ncbi:MULTISPECIES: hypothetical protein [Ornithinibacillus]|uniref:Uncharacterized protein n=2 Tax=Ornithinibacillus TaxID=484508 RepID=A0A923L8H3_9BACI|nr:MULTISPECIES: hypothetical protein [Ornithinibacillus]MBC5638312.1 hypothetical protein [Ornithinibacillus hominis]MBS3680908.1 hypothetical protein [Ornithinibacillus massiliensis]
MASNSKFKDPGFILTIVLVLYAGFVFIWWPTDIYVAGISLVGWLMFIGLFFWFLLAIIYCLWIEKREREKNRLG